MIKIKGLFIFCFFLNLFIICKKTLYEHPKTYFFFQKQADINYVYIIWSHQKEILLVILFLFLIIVTVSLWVFYLRRNRVIYNTHMGFLSGSAVKNLPANAGDKSLIPGLEISSGERNGNLLQHSCLENFQDRGAWQAIVHGAAKDSDMI